MAWPKIKNIIILMLLVTNLCLLAFVGWREIRDWQLQDKALEQAVSFLAERGIQAEVLKLNQISPLEYETLAPWLSGKRMLAVAEDAFGAGCVGQRVAAILAQHGQAPEKLVLINLGKTFLPEGAVPQLEHQAGIDAAGIARAVQEART